MRPQNDVSKAQADAVNLDKIGTVCLALGPYRNLTTLTASIIALHPNCQVLNHAGDRTFSNKELNIFYDYSDEKFDKFLKYAVIESTRGKQGQYGGSILYSHAFDANRKMPALYAKMYGNKLLKDDIRCLFWKEPLRTANYIRNHNVDLGEILSRNDRLKFVMPVRNPMDCAKSNLKTGHVKLFSGLALPASVENVLLAIFNEYLWFLDLKSRYPSRFFYYFEHQLGVDTLKDLASFLGLGFDDQWCAAAIEGFSVKSPYQHTDQLKDFYTHRVNELFEHQPEFAEKLLLF